MQFLEHDEEGWYDEEQGDGANAHTADDTKSEGTVTIRTGTTLNYERYHTDNHRSNGHQDWAQTLLAGSEGRISDTHAMFAVLRGHLGNQDGGLGEQADQHDHTRLQVDVVLHALYTKQGYKPGDTEGTHQTERHTEQHGPRCEP